MVVNTELTFLRARDPKAKSSIYPEPTSANQLFCITFNRIWLGGQLVKWFCCPQMGAGTQRKHLPSFLACSFSLYTRHEQTITC